MRLFLKVWSKNDRIMELIKCIKCCEEKEISQFYKNRTGILYTCKECFKSYRKKFCETKEGRAYGKEYRSKNKARANKYAREHVRKRPRKITKIVKYSEKNDSQKERIKKSVKKWEENNKGKVKARNKLNSFMRYRGLKKPSVCSSCGNYYKLIHGHHEDYNKPLEVIWLCLPCHRKIHRKYK